MFTACILISLVAGFASPQQDQDWWKSATFYQIYPRSFKDSNNDGIGDIPGIISKLDHFVDAGITAIWLSPVMSSPQVDAGYDISNFTDIHHEYGTLEDFDNMVREAHARNIKVILDFVPNHSSDQHEWFNKSQNREPGYEDYYIWMDPNPETGGVPNNWLSVFKYSAWEWSPIRNQYYLHQFTIQQPDLNFRNPAVVQEMKDVLTFWLDRDVDGFRVDAIPHLFEDPTYPDEPPSNDPNWDPWQWESLLHIYTKDQPETYDMVYQWRELTDEYSAAYPEKNYRILMTEAYTSLENTVKYYGDGTRLGAQFSFNFIMITNLNRTSTAQNFVDQVESWMALMTNGFVANWVLGNHDNHRVASRYGPENADGLNMLIAMLPGVAVTYNGEEIGMENGEVTWEQGQDPSACNGDPEDFDKVSRDFERTPFHWDDTVNAGFNEGAETWLPVSSKYLTNNLASQNGAGVKSHFSVYKELMQLRKDNVLKTGSYSMKAIGEEVIALLRYIDTTTPGYILLFNKGSTEVTIDLTVDFPEITENLSVHITSTGSSKNPGDVLSRNSVVLGANEAIIAKEVMAKAI